MRLENPIGDLTDALGDVRNRIKELQQKEAALQRAILDARPIGPVSGRHFSLQIKDETRRRFDPRFLPNHLRTDARFWVVSQSQTVVTRTLIPQNCDVLNNF